MKQMNYGTIMEKLESALKTDIRYLIRGGFWSMAGQGTAALIAFIFAVVVGHVLPKETYGEYKYILSVVAVLTTFSMTGIGAAVFQSVARGFDGALREGFWANIRWSFVIFIGAFASAAYYYIRGNETLAFGILLGGSLTPFLTSANLVSTYLAAKKDFRRQHVYFDGIENLVPYALLLITILSTRNAAVIAGVYFASNTAITFYLYWRTVRIYRPDASKRDPEMLSYGKHLSAMGILSGIAGNLDQILLFHYVGAAELAVYTFARAIPDQSKGPLKSFDLMLQTNFANRDSREIRDGMRNKVFWIAIVSILAIGLYIVLAPYVFKLFFPKYVDAVRFSQIYALSFLGVPFTPLSSYLTAKKRVREQYVSGVSTAFFRIGALFVGAYYWGLLGVAAAQVVTRAYGTWIVYVLYKRSFKDAPRADSPADR